MAGRAELTKLVDAFLERLAILDWTHVVSHHDALIRASLERAGRPIGNLDLLIAAHAVARGMTLVTNTQRHFSHRPDLDIEVWS